MSIDAFIYSSRRDFDTDDLILKSIPKNPMSLFSYWLQEAVNSNLKEANAMVVSTLGLDGFPNSRVVLLRKIWEDNFVFFTNYDSEKGLEIEKEPKISLNFFWSELNRQVRVQGLCEKWTKEDSQAYFMSRPRDSRIAAWASPQSRAVKEGFIEKNYQKYQAKFEGKPVLCPENWGGYIVKPSKMEFWLGKPSRLHTRFLYTVVDNKWTIKCLAP